MKNGRYHFFWITSASSLEKMLIQVYFMLLQLHIKIIFYYSRFYGLIMYKLRSSDEELIFIIAIEWRWKERSDIKPQTGIDNHLLISFVISQHMYEVFHICTFNEGKFVGNQTFLCVPLIVAKRHQLFYMSCSHDLFCRMPWSYITHSC